MANGKRKGEKRKLGYPRAAKPIAFTVTADPISVLRKEVATLTAERDALQREGASLLAAKNKAETLLAVEYTSAKDMQRSIDKLVNVADVLADIAAKAS